MQIKIRTLLIALPLLAAACSEAPDRDAGNPAGTIPVSVGAVQQVSIKPLTSMGDDGITVKWIAGDKIALWAVDSQGSAALAAHPFSMYHYNASFDSARFTADIPVMAEDTYKYYAVSPTPDAVEGTMASFDIPSVQDGLRTLACDVMVAAPVEGKALQKGDNSEIVSMRFKHKVHVLKIRIPDNKMGMPVSGLSLTFPVPVTGRLTVHATDPSAPAQLAPTEAGKMLYLDFAEPKDVGDVVFAVIAPVALTAADQIEIKAYTDTKESFPTTMYGKNYAEGHTTPISLTIPELYRVTRIFFSLDGDGTSTLGEKINSFTLEAPAGTDLGNGSNQRNFVVDADNNYEIFYEGQFSDNLSGKAFTVKFDSENALVSSVFTMPQIAVDGRTEVTAFKVPYLMFEDFGNVPSFNNHDDAGGGVTIDSYVDAIDLTSKGLPGWSGTRCGGQLGNAFRICVRTEDGWLAAARYHGRVDTAPLSGIKAGKTVKVAVSFKYSIDISWDKHKPLMAYGYHTTQGLIKSINDGSTALSSPVAKDITGTGGSYANINTSASYTIPTCTSQHRLAWDIYSANRKTGNSNGWCYLDDIKVQIAK